MISLISGNKGRFNRLADEHYRKICSTINRRIQNLETSPYRLFIEQYLKAIIIGTPDVLMDLDSEYKEIQVSNGDDQAGETLAKKVFKYKYFTEKRTPYNAYGLAQMLDVNTCPYCNRVYTLTAIRRNSRLITRPELDHFFPQSKYPLLALSFFNLIPSCHICNSTIKGSRNLNLDQHVHPYQDEVVSQYHFTYVPETYEGLAGLTKDFTIGIKPSQSHNPETYQRVQNTFGFFQLDTIYQYHQDLVQDILMKRDIFSEDYLSMLAQTYPNLGTSKAELYYFAFGNFYEEKDFSKRPFSKLTKDIAVEAGLVEED